MRTETDGASRSSAEQRQDEDQQPRRQKSTALPTKDPRHFRKVYHSEFSTPPDDQPEHPPSSNPDAASEPEEQRRRPGHERLGIASVMGLIICAAVLALAAFFAPSALAWSIVVGILLAALILWWFRGLDEIVFPQRNKTRPHSHHSRGH